MSQDTQNQPAGVLLVDKPQGITSHDVVDRVRRIFRMKKVGHAGTLDPMATGLLILLIGKATKISQYLMSLDKVYEGTMHLGQSTDSHDAEGEVVKEMELPADLDAEKLKAYAGEFLETNTRHLRCSLQRSRTASRYTSSPARAKQWSVSHASFV